jgi:hypothetical protein
MSETIHSPEFLSSFIILASKDCSKVARGGGGQGQFAAAQASKELHSVVQADSVCFCKSICTSYKYTTSAMLQKALVVHVWATAP